MLTRTPTSGRRHDASVEVVDVDHDALSERRLEVIGRLAGPVEDDLGAGYAHGQGLVQLHAGDHLGPRALLVEGAADGAEVVGLVGPRDGEVGEPTRELIAELADSLAQQPLGEDEDGRAVGGHELVDRDALDLGHGANGWHRAELRGPADGVSDDDGSFVARLHGSSPLSCGASVLSVGRVVPDAVSCSKVDRSEIWSMEIRTKSVPGR